MLASMIMHSKQRPHDLNSMIASMTPIISRQSYKLSLLATKSTNTPIKLSKITYRTSGILQLLLPFHCTSTVLYQSYVSFYRCEKCAFSDSLVEVGSSLYPVHCSKLSESHFTTKQQTIGTAHSCSDSATKLSTIRTT